MFIVAVTYRNRDDFHFISLCPHCSHQSRWTDGYADHYYQKVVLPHRHCPNCRLDDFGDPTEELAASAVRYPEMMNLREPANT